MPNQTSIRSACFKISISLFFSVALISATFIIYGVIVGFSHPRNHPSVAGPAITRFDKNLGFRPIPNLDARRSHVEPGAVFQIFTDDQGARRASRENLEDGSLEPRLLFIGCSYSYGWGLEAEDTYPRLVAQALGVSYSNFAFPSFSGLQSLLVLQEHGADAELVVYGFIDAQIDRNVTPLAPTLSPYASYVPFVTKNKDGHWSVSKAFLKDNIYQSERYYQYVPAWWHAPEHLRVGYSVFIDKVRSFLAMRNRLVWTEDDKLQAAAWIIHQMERSTAQAGANLLVVNVGIGRSDKEFRSLSQMSWQSHVRFLDASEPSGHPITDLVIPNDGHPNALANKLIANCIVDQIKAMILPPVAGVSQGSDSSF